MKKRNFFRFPFSLISARGQTLLELLIALAIGAILVTSAVAGVTKTLNNAQTVAYESQATKYAQEGMEIVQQIRDNDYTSFQNYNGTYCMDKGVNVLGSPTAKCVSPNVDKFIRSVLIEQNGCAANISRITVIVSWADTSCLAASYCRSVPIASCLSTINPALGP